jgi:hypothetical protein
MNNNRAVYSNEASHREEKANSRQDLIIKAWLSIAEKWKTLSASLKSCTLIRVRIMRVGSLGITICKRKGNKTLKTICCCCKATMELIAI